ncbi:hypothetical protein I6E74_09945 [Salinibacterium sp. SWN139]|uniref:hypothetical protein n=1 Tax=Salinibacterium sp. SWN139 TaxID=2792055 RepID=UPI0018CE4397|nr:hypothetical protein [Salinibacterium sp. SWN139]MBH0054486.1 hypothetical protein [Salinibacterium sp. SWN139]
MASTFSTAEATVTPVVVDGFKSSRESRNVIHNVLGANAPAVTLRDAGVRTGTLTALFRTLAEAQSFEAVLATGQVIQFEDSDNATLTMDFILDGELTVELEDDSRSLWLVEFDFQEVA